MGYETTENKMLANAILFDSAKLLFAVHSHTIRTEVPQAVVMALINPTDAPNTQTTEANHAYSSQIVNIGSDPSATVEFTKRLRSFVIPSDKNGQYRRFLLSRIVHGKGSKVPKLGRYRRAMKVSRIAMSLEVSTAKQKIYFLARLGFMNE